MNVITKETPSIDIEEIKVDGPVTAVLKKTRTFLSNPDNWCTHEYQKGNRYCAIGAVHKFDSKEDEPIGTYELRSEVLRLMNRLSKHGSIILHNDLSSHDDILELFDKSIAKAEEEGI